MAKGTISHIEFPAEDADSAERGSTPERIGLLIAEFTGPLRTCAATLLELEGLPLAPPREALEKVVAGLDGVHVIEEGPKGELALQRRERSDLVEERGQVALGDKRRVVSA